MTSPAPLGRDDADRALTGLGAAHDRIAAAMYAIDVHPALAMLRGGTLTGATESRWRVVRPEVDLLWAHFAVLGQLLEEARVMRGSRRPGDAGWVRLTGLLRDPVVELAADGMPVSTPGTAASRIALGELARQLEQRCAGVAVHLSEVDAAFSAVATRLAGVTAAVDAVVTLATELAEPATAARLRTSLEQAQQLDLGDPLTAAPGGRLAAATEKRWTDLAAEAAQARQLLDELARVRSSYPRLRSSLASLVDDLAAAEEAVAQANVRVGEKIADPGLTPPPAATRLLRGRLGELDRLYQEAQSDGQLWRRLADDLVAVERAAAQARHRAAELRQLAEGLLARRDELRGRLSAYRAKAAARGLAEHPDLTELHAQARALLYAAPCDLRASTRSVHAYQQKLAEVLAQGSRSDVDD